MMPPPRGIWLLFAALFTTTLIITPSATAGPCRSSSNGVIIDTDMEIDDVAAVVLALALEQRGEANVLAMGVQGSNPFDPPTLDGINTYYGRGDIPIGVRLEGQYQGKTVDHFDHFSQYIAEHFPHKQPTTDVALLYRQVLASQPDNSVVFLALGPLTNLANLLSFPPDTHSPMTGGELVAAKVSLLSVMGGSYPQGGEWNFQTDPSAAKMVVENWPSPTLFSGFEIGENLLAGRGLWDGLKEETANPVRKAMELSVGPGKHHEMWSWDLTSVLVGVRGAEGYWGLVSGSNTVDAATGNNTWVECLPGRPLQQYLVVQKDPVLIGQEMDELMTSVKAPTASNLRKPCQPQA